MNALELADEIGSLLYPYCEEAAEMLRQQANKIVELEKTNQEMSDLYEKEIDKRADRIAQLEKEIRVSYAWNTALAKQLGGEK